MASVVGSDDGSIEVRLDYGAIQRMLSDPNGMTGKYLFALGQRIRNRAAENSPVDTGRLRASITATIEGSGSTDLVLALGSDVEYARYVHDGTMYMAARPFLADAVATELGSI